MLIRGFVTDGLNRSLLSGARSLLFPISPNGNVRNAPKSDCCNPSQSPADDPGTDRPMSSLLAPRGGGDAQSIGATYGASQCGTSDTGAGGGGADAGGRDNGAGAACAGSGA